MQVCLRQSRIRLLALPPIAALFAAFLGYNPMATLVPKAALQLLPAASQANILGKSFFPNLISNPFMTGLHAVFYLSAALCLISAIASLFRGKRYIHSEVESAQAPEALEEGAPILSGES